MGAPLVFLDVDKTLLHGYSGYFSTLRLIRSGAVRKRHIAKAIFYKLISPVYHADVRKMYEILLGDLEGWPLDRVLAIGRECFEQDLHPRIYREGLAMIRSHQDQGHDLYLVTSGPFMVMKVLGDFLGVCADYAPGPVVANGTMQREIREPLAYKSGKLEIARLLVQKHDVSLQDCYFYTDSIDDIALLEAVGKPHAVNPEKRLKKLALQRGWPILNFREQLGEVS